MTQWLDWARGPAFRFCIAILVLGMFRLLLLNAIHLVVVMRRAKGREIPWGSVIGRTMSWLFPFKVSRRDVGLTLVSVVFHIAAILTPVFLYDHIRLWRRGLGISWPALPQLTADVLTLVTIFMALILFLRRLAPGASRALSTHQDFVLPLLIAVPFASGYLAMHPGINPFPYEGTLLVHVLSGNVAMAILPFTKLSHAVLFPLSQLLSETGWYLCPNAGQQVAATLGKENSSI